MTEEVKHPDRQAWWEKGKRLVLVSQGLQALLVVGGTLWGSYIIIRNEISDIISNPKKTAVLTRRVDSAIAAYDTLHAKQFTPPVLQRGITSNLTEKE